MVALEEGMGLERARHALKMLMVHGGDQLSEPIKQQRNSLLDIAIKLLDSACEKKIDEATAQWLSYKRNSNAS
jgi:hypothetical protein